MIEIENIYKLKYPLGFSFLDEFEIPSSELSSLILMFDYHLYDKNSAINYFIHDYRKIESPNISNLKEHLSRFLDFYCSNISNIYFIETLAKTYLINYKNQFAEKYKHPLLPKNNIENSIYLDLVTGFDFINFYEHLEAENSYYLTDKSIFTCKCLELKSKELNLSNITILSKDILDLENNDFEKQVGLIRAKNVFRYVPLFFTHLTFFKSLLPFNGRFVFQERAMDNIIFNNFIHYDKIKNLFLDGWDYSEERGNASNPLDFDSMIFTKI